jgi:hypothetical protein
MEGETRPAWLEDRRRPEADPLKIALGVAAGILVAGAIALVARLWFVDQALGRVNEAVMTINKQTQQQIERERERAAAVQAAARQQEAERRAIEAATQRAKELETKERLTRQIAKEEAWKRYYQRPDTCDRAEGQAFVECANQHIRAKRKFEELWAAGKL